MGRQSGIRLILRNPFGLALEVFTLKRPVATRLRRIPIMPLQHWNQGQAAL
jgi:hypothetical protein